MVSHFLIFGLSGRNDGSLNLTVHILEVVSKMASYVCSRFISTLKKHRGNQTQSFSIPHSEFYERWPLVRLQLTSSTRKTPWLLKGFCRQCRRRQLQPKENEGKATAADCCKLTFMLARSEPFSQLPYLEQSNAS